MPTVTENFEDAAKTPSDELRVVDRMANIFAHEMNTILATIMGLASVIEYEVEQDSPIAQDVQGILTASQKGLEWMRSILGFSPKEGEKKTTIMMNRMLGIITSLLQQNVTESIKIQSNLATDLVEIEGYSSQIKHMLLSLCSNAVDAIQGKGAVTLTSQNVFLGENDVLPMGGAKPGQYIRIQIADTGQGMEEQTLSHAFKPFFTTNPAGKHLGLGLSLAYQVVRRHQGKISIYSKKGLGTTVTIHLPAADSIDGIASEDQQELPLAQGETLLLVDDEQLHLKTYGRMLEKLGYSVRLALNGEEAVQCYKEHGDEIDFVLMDLIMPVMDGAEALKQIRQIDPEACVIISSGYSEAAPMKELVAKGAIGFVEKPFTLKELADKLEQCRK